MECTLTRDCRILPEMLQHVFKRMLGHAFMYNVSCYMNIINDYINSLIHKIPHSQVWVNVCLGLPRQSASGQPYARQAHLNMYLKARGRRSILRQSSRMYTPIGVLSGRNLERKVYGRDAGRSSSNQECTYLWRASVLSITTSPESLMAPRHTSPNEAKSVNLDELSRQTQMGGKSSQQIQYMNKVANCRGLKMGLQHHYSPVL